MSQSQLTIPFQENLLILLCFDKDYAQLIRNSVPLDYFDSTLYPIAKHAYSFLDRFGEPPQEHIADLLDEEMSNQDQREVLEPIITQLYEAKETVNQKYVVNNLETFLRSQNLRSAIIEAANVLQDDEDETALNKAENILHEGSKHRLQLFDPGENLNDVERVFEWMRHRHDDFQLGIPPLDERSATPMRGGLLLFIAPPKRGKCLIAGTQILLPDGTHKPIEEVVAEKTPEVVSYNPITRSFQTGKVVDHMDNGTQPVGTLTTRTGRQITATPNHPFWTLDGWKELQDLSVGDRVGVPRDIVEDEIFWDFIVSIEWEDEPQRTYDLTVEGLHNFVANGFVVHNSQFLIHVGRQALLNKAKVLHITLEMPSEQVLQRYWQSLFGITKYDMTMRLPQFMLDHNGELIDLEFQSFRPNMHFDDEQSERWVKERIGQFHPKNRLVVKNFPPRQLDINSLKVYLDDLEMIHKFVPDIIVLDYADDMYIPTDNYRLELGNLIRDLRAIAVNRHCAMVTASQSNREGASKKRLTDVDVSEDWSKIFTADVIITYSRTEEEKALNLGRLWVPNARDDFDNFGVLLSQNYAMAQFAVDSVYLKNEHEEILDRYLSGRP